MVRGNRPLPLCHARVGGGGSTLYIAKRSVTRATSKRSPTKNLWGRCVGIIWYWLTSSNVQFDARRYAHWNGTRIYACIVSRALLARAPLRTGWENTCQSNVLYYRAFHYVSPFCENTINVLSRNVEKLIWEMFEKWSLIAVPNFPDRLQKLSVTSNGNLK